MIGALSTRHIAEQMTAAETAIAEGRKALGAATLAGDATGQGAARERIRAAEEQHEALVAAMPLRRVAEEREAKESRRREHLALVVETHEALAADYDFRARLGELRRAMQTVERERAQASAQEQLQRLLPHMGPSDPNPGEMEMVSDPDRLRAAATRHRQEAVVLAEQLAIELATVAVPVVDTAAVEAAAVAEREAATLRQRARNFGVQLKTLMSHRLTMEGNGYPKGVQEDDAAIAQLRAEAAAAGVPLEVG